MTTTTNKHDRDQVCGQVMVHAPIRNCRMPMRPGRIPEALALLAKGSAPAKQALSPTGTL